jgi:hypothetical protein
VSTRVTAGRTTLGATPLATDRDVPPGPFSAVGTPGVLPFFATLQRQIPGTFSADVSLAYTPAELARAGILPGSPPESALAIGTFVNGACMTGLAPCAEDGDCGANGPCVGATYSLLPTTIDATNHTATATTTSFSTFAVLNPNVLTGGPVVPLVPGGGSARTDCRAEWEVVNPGNTPPLVHGLLSTTQTCADGDPLCDGDAAADNNCHFRVAVCLNQTDPNLPACTPNDTASVRINRPRPAAERANADALLAALTGLGGTLSGRKLDTVTFSPTLAGARCSAFVQVSVPKGTRQQLHLRGMSSTRPADSDRLRLVCT